MKRINPKRQYLIAVLLIAVFALMSVVSASASCSHEFIYDNASDAGYHRLICKICGYEDVQAREYCKYDKKTYLSYTPNNHYRKVECVCGSYKTGPEKHTIVNGKCACGFAAKVPGKFAFTKTSATKAQKTSVTIPGQWKDHKWYPAHQETRYATKLTLKWKKSANATHYCIVAFQGGNRVSLPGSSVEQWKKTTYSEKVNLHKTGKIKIEITPYNGAIPGKKITKTITVK